MTRLTRLVAEPGQLAEVAREALAIMHFDASNGLPEAATALIDEPGTACVAACYRCLMSYYNQPDHELLDRRDDDAKALLVRLGRARLNGLEDPIGNRTTQPSASPGIEPMADGGLGAWLAYAEVNRGVLPRPDRSWGWSVAALNLLGSIAFGVSAVAARYVGTTGNVANLELVNLGTFVGAVCFLVGAALLPVESARDLVE